RLVVVVLEQSQIHAVGVNNAYANVFAQERSNARIAFDDARIELRARFTGNAAKYNQQGPVCLLCQLERIIQIVVNPESVREDGLSVFQDPLLSRFLLRERLER